jgi:hypothetical protein
MKTNYFKLGLMLAVCVPALGLPSAARAQVSMSDFNALKATVDRLSTQMASVLATNQVLVQVHAQDEAKINQLTDKLSETDKTANDAEQKSIAVAQTQAQPPARAPLDEATVNHNFQILGDAEFQYDKVDNQHGSFLQADFAPIFLYRGGDNILFEAGFDTTLQNNAPSSAGYTTTFNLSFAQLDYVVNDYVTLCAGDLLLPLGTYTQRGAGWLNKIPDNPLAVDALIPGSGLGAELQGAVPVGQAGKFINYAVFGVNGPGSSDGMANAGSLDLGGNVGVRSDGVTANLHGSPSGGARVGFFVPFSPHNDLEVGLSGMSGEWDDAGTHIWSAGVLDAALHLGPNFEAKGEYIISRFGSDDLGQVRQQGWYTQVGYKLAGLNLELPGINNTELVGRYDFYYDGMGTRTSRTTAGIVYYLTNTLLLEGDYEFYHSTDPTQANQLLLQLSLGF